ncbi:MAG: hypothetical protein ACOX1A_09320 [Saccharofermentanales bacterium]
MDEMNTIDDIDQIIVVSNDRFARQFEQWAAITKCRGRNRRYSDCCSQ